jgi:hypothetical protein
MPLTANVVSIQATDESVSVLVSYKDERGIEVGRRSLAFGQGASRVSVQTEIQRAGNTLDNISSILADLEPLKAAPIVIVRGQGSGAGSPRP